MDFYTHDHMVGELLELIKKTRIDNIGYEASWDNPDINPANDSRYAVLPVGQMLNNKEFLYQYPVKEENIPLRLRPNAPNKLDISSRNFLSEFSKRYIGNPDVNYEVDSFGFRRNEFDRIDQAGLIRTGENVIFLTFDDWGSDATVNKLLYVLRKHDVKATFFVLTYNISNNTNLLRAIAAEGHEIANHSDTHQPMAVFNPKRHRYVAGNQSKEEYIKELNLSYKKLADVVGDVTYNGNPVLFRYFRPPTLAISRQGIEAVFESNFEYIVSGSYSANDYIARDIAECLDDFKRGLYTPSGNLIRGAVLIMHFSDHAPFTPMALDILLTANASKEDTDPTKFRVGKLSDYLRDGYSQIVLGR